MPPPSQRTGTPAAAASPRAETSWARALDALVAGDHEAALAALAAIDADPAATAEQRGLARDLRDRIRARQAAAAATSTAAPLSESTAEAPGDHRGGRPFLLGTTTLAGLALWGWTLPSMLDVQNDRAFIGLYMVTAGASFGVPFLLTRTGPATWGMANMTWLGASRGALAGIGVSALFAGGSDLSDRNLAGSALVGSVVGAAAATLWARRADMAPGTAHLEGVAGDVGALTGLALAHVTGVDGRSQPELGRDLDVGNRMRAVFALGGGALGWVGGHFLAQRGQFTWGDAEVMRLPIAIGVNGAAMVMDWADADSSRAIVGALAVGGLAGAVLGERLVDARDYGVGQGFLLDLGTVSGALLSMGSVYLVSGSSSSTTYLTSSFVGATAAFSVLYLTLDTPIARRISARLTPDGDGASRVALLPYVGAGAGAARGLALAGTF